MVSLEQVTDMMSEICFKTYKNTYESLKEWNFDPSFYSEVKVEPMEYVVPEQNVLPNRPIENPIVANKEKQIETYNRLKKLYSN